MPHQQHLRQQDQQHQDQQHHQHGQGRGQGRGPYGADPFGDAQGQPQGEQGHAEPEDPALGSFAGPGGMKLPGMAGAPDADGASIAAMGNSASLAEMRVRLLRLRERSDVPQWRMIEAEMAFVHALSITERPKEARECLAQGERLWRELQDVEEHDGRSSMSGLTLQLCTAMRRSAKTIGDPTLREMWMRRLNERRRLVIGITPQQGPRVEVDERGVRRVKDTGVKATHRLWASLRRPQMNLPFAKGVTGPDPNEGPRY